MNDLRFFLHKMTFVLVVMAIGKKTKVKTFYLTQQSRKQRLQRKIYVTPTIVSNKEWPTKSNWKNIVWLNVNLNLPEIRIFLHLKKVFITVGNRLNRYSQTSLQRTLTVSLSDLITLSVMRNLWEGCQNDKGK